MKSISVLLSCATLAFAPPLFASEGEESERPIGSLDAEQAYVRSGTHAQVSWDITYPPDLTDLIIPLPGGRVITKEELRVRMRVVGVAFQSGSTLLPVEFSTKIGPGPWQELFSGTSESVQASQYVLDQVVPANTTIDFRGRGRRSSGGWYDPRWTSGSDLAVIGLMDGDTPPSYAPAYEQGSVESFLSSYIAADNTILLGPLDMIYLFELASRDPGDWWFDMQDLVVVVSYERTTTTAAP